MPVSNVQASQSNLRSSREKMPAGFKTKVVAPRNPKLVKRETNSVKVSTLIYLNTFLFFTLFVKQLNLCLQTST